MSMARCPVLILTGDLGAGKTTLLNTLLAEAGGRRVTVIENEAGEIGIDCDLVVGAASVLDLPDGCACCTVRGALHAMLDELAARAGELDALIIELSGLADPLAVLQAFHAPHIRAAFGVPSLAAVTTADGATEGVLWRRQLRFADAVVISKLTPGSHPQTALLGDIRAAAPRATSVLVATHATLEHLLDVRRPQPAAPAHADAAHDHGPDPAPKMIALEQAGDVDRAALDTWLMGEIAAAGPGLLRVKAIAALSGSDRRYVVQVAHGQWDSYAERPWLGPRRTRIVFIGYDLDRDRLQAELHRCRAPERVPS